MAIAEITVKADVSEIENLIDQLKELQTYKLYEGAEQTLVDIDEIVKIFADHVEAEAAQPEPQWIPCSERLPEENGRYLVTRGLNACGALWNRTYILNYSDLMGLKKEKIWWNGNVGKSDFERYDDVIAWMPLPEPYREEGD